MIDLEWVPKIEFLSKTRDVLAFFQLFFLNEEFQILINNINKNTYILNLVWLKKNGGTSINRTFAYK